MITPTEEDIGRIVLYDRKWSPVDTEIGIITSFNDKYVFVRYARQHPTANGEATCREHLEWVLK